MSIVGIAKHTLQVVDMLGIALHRLIASSSFLARSTGSILQSYQPDMSCCPHHHRLDLPNTLAAMSSVRIYPRPMLCSVLVLTQVLRRQVQSLLWHHHRLQVDLSNI